MRLAKKVAIITGAATGIGRAAALLFAREGARVVVADVDEEGGRETVTLIEEAGGEALYVRVDVTRPTDVERMVRTAVETYGRLDVLFNNAAVNLAATVTETSEEAWDRIMAVNVKGVFLGCKYAIPAMVAGGGGVIVNTASAAAIVGLKGLAAYTASKGAVLQLTRNVALDYADQKIRANALCPGVTATAMTLSVIEKSPNPEAMRQRMDAGRPLGRMADPEEIARAALFLASEESSFMTGVPLIVDGGFTAE
jgi:NAD(P)-dependent dehydrogenase (short-subunit alcohol dehydrogenase family)